MVTRVSPAIIASLLLATLAGDLSANDTTINHSSLAPIIPYTIEIRGIEIDGDAPTLKLQCYMERKNKYNIAISFKHKHLLAMNLENFPLSIGTKIKSAMPIVSRFDDYTYFTTSEMDGKRIKNVEIKESIEIISKSMGRFLVHVLVETFEFNNPRTRELMDKFSVRCLGKNH